MRQLHPAYLTLGLIGLITCCTGSDEGDDAGTASDVRRVTGLGKCKVQEEGYYYIATLLPLSGQLDYMGKSDNYAVMMALAEINDAGGIKGKKVGLIMCDNETDPDSAGVPRAIELGGVEPLVGFVGPITSALGTKLGEVVKEHEIIGVSGGSSSPLIPDMDDGNFFFRTFLGIDKEGRVAAQVANRRGKSKVLTAARDDPYGAGASLGLTEALTALGGTAGEHLYDDSVEGWDSAALDAVEAFGPDGVYIVPYLEDGAAIIKGTIARGLHPMWILSHSGMSPAFLELINDALNSEGIVALEAARPQPRFDEFVARYKDAWTDEPDVCAVEHYDATYLLAMAMHLADDADNTVQVRDALQNSTRSGIEILPPDWAGFLQAVADGATNVDYKGASGEVDFDAKGDIQGEIREHEAQGGELVYVGCWREDGASCD